MRPSTHSPTIAETHFQAALADSLGAWSEPDLPRAERQAVERILQENWRRGRMQKFLQGDLANLPAYVARVIHGWRTHAADLHALQITRSDVHWQELYTQMVGWTYRFLISRGAYDPGARQYAEACATEAVPILQTAYFPYDVAFEAWARVIVINVCRKNGRTAKKKSTIPGDQLLELDALVQEPASPEVWQPDLRLDLAQALLSLNPARQEVMRLIYLEGYSVVEVAEMTGKTPSAVYNLHYYAILELRKHMQNWIKDE